MVVAPSTSKRLAEFAAHFQVEGHDDDVFVLSSTMNNDRSHVIAQSTARATTAASALLFNTCLVILATSAAMLALHLITRHYQEENRMRKVTTVRRHDERSSSSEEKRKSKERHQHAESELPPSLVPEPYSAQGPTTLITRRIKQQGDGGKPHSLTSPRCSKNDQMVQQQQSTLLPFIMASPQTKRPLKARVQEIVEISKTIDGLSESRVLDIAVRLAQIESNEHLKMTELAIHQCSRAIKADQKERHHREHLEEQGKDQKWRRRLDSKFRDTVEELFSSTSALALFLTCSVLLDYFATVWNEFMADPLAYTAGLICEQAAIETSTRRRDPMWFVGTWAYDYIRSTKTDMACGLSIVQYVAAVVVVIGVHRCLPGIVGRGIQHICLGAILVKLSLRLLALEEMLLGAFIVVFYFLLFGGGVLSYHCHTKSYFRRQQRLPRVLEMDAVEDVFDQARIGFVICKLLAAVTFCGRVIHVVWAKSQ